MPAHATEHHVFNGYNRQLDTLEQFALGGGWKAAKGVPTGVSQSFFQESVMPMADAVKQMIEANFLQ